MVQIAIMGYGVVGSGVAEVIQTHKKSLKSHSKNIIDIKYILDLRDFPDSPFADRFTKNFEDIVNDSEIQIVVEAMGGLNPAYDFVKRCLQAGKSVVTSNKELIAEKGADLLNVALDNNVNLLFEASVGGGIPILRPLNQCLAANNFLEIAGILNGTTNYILTKMINDNIPFDTALKQAQELGYAERNPDCDVKGYDTCRKICILSSLAYGEHIYPKNVYCEGIEKITLTDVKYADMYGGVIKLIGRTRRLENGMLDITVCPMIIKKEHLLASVNDVFNAILVKGDSTGDVIFYGRGAGKLPTASAVVADVIDCVKHIHARKYLYWEDSDNKNIMPYEYSMSRMYFRIKCENINFALSKATDLLGGITLIGTDEEELAFTMDKELPLKDITKAENIMLDNNIEICSVIKLADF
ncbi:MAG: homoserine dehydrogenase [Clostridiales bacterium]|nr:homoserine dehydrogenase [Clostridiales bacterium]